MLSSVVSLFSVVRKCGFWVVDKALFGTLEIIFSVFIPLRWVLKKILHVGMSSGI